MMSIVLQLYLVKVTADASSKHTDYPPSQALDGKLSFINGSRVGGCALTKVESTPMWSAELTYQSYVKKVRIMPRTDCCRTYPPHHVVAETSIDGKGEWRRCTTLWDKYGKATTWVDIDCNVYLGTRTKFVRILQHYDKGPFTVCEVEVLGDPGNSITP